MTSEQHPFSETLGGVPLQIAYGDATIFPKTVRVPHAALKSFQGSILESAISAEDFEKFSRVVFPDLFRTSMSSYT